MFTYGGDLWLGSVRGGEARRITAGPGPETHPFFSKDGSQIAFTGVYDGAVDVYVMPARGGQPKRLTFDPEGDIVVGWTPGGKIAYVTTHGSPLDRQARLMLVDPAGGLPAPTPLMEVGDASFSPDGTSIAYDRNPSNLMNWRRYRGGSQGVVSIFNLKTDAYSELPHGTENSWDPLWVGRSIYFISDKYKGTVNLFRYDLDAKRSVRLTSYADDDIKTIRTDGTQIVFERDGYLYDMPLPAGPVRRLDPLVQSDGESTRPALKKLGGQIDGIALSPSGERVAVEARGRLFTLPARSGEARPIAVSDDARVKSPDWSPDGLRIAYLSDASGEYQVYVVPQEGAPLGEKPQLVPTDLAYKLTAVQWMPDSLHLLVTTLDDRLLLLDPATGALKEVFHAEPGEADFDPSPDSAWIAYVKPTPNGFSAVWLYQVATGKSTQITDGRYRDDDVSFDVSGKYLYLVSARTVNPIPGDFERGLATYGAQRLYAFLLAKDAKNPFAVVDDEEQTADEQDEAGPPSRDEQGRGGAGGGTGGEGAPPKIKVDLDGLAGRLVPLPIPPGPLAFVVGADNGLYFSDGSTLLHYEIGGDVSPMLQGAGLDVAFNASRTKLAYVAGGVLGIVEAHPGIRPAEGRVDLGGLETVIDPKKEWKEMYWDAWRWERDAFYDPKFAGVDWKAVGLKYAKFLDDVADRSDLNYVLGLMIGELGTSHAYVEGGDFGPALQQVPVGQLGADFVSDHGALRIAKIYRGRSFDEADRSPLGEPGLGVEEGDYLLAIDQRRVRGDEDPDALLVDKADRVVSLVVNSKPTLDGARRVAVRPVASEGELRYIDWVEANRRLVDKLSGGRIGYMHVPDTDEAGIADFVKGFYSQTDKQALIVDERWNSGGDIPTFFTEKLQRTEQAVIKSRYGRNLPVPQEAIPGPKVMLINGYSASGGDLFAYLFKKEKLGELVGTRTWGGLVGFSEPYMLEDGGAITAPEFGIYDPATDRWIAENHGIDPDVFVDMRPDLVAKGVDPQLQTAVAVLLAKLKAAANAKPPAAPPFPDSGSH